jgi:hypothetical protein
VKRLVQLPTSSRLFPRIGTKEGARQTTRNRTFQVKIDENQQSEEFDAFATHSSLNSLRGNCGREGRLYQVQSGEVHISFITAPKQITFSCLPSTVCGITAQLIKY